VSGGLVEPRLDIPPMYYPMTLGPAALKKAAARLAKLNATDQGDDMNKFEKENQDKYAIGQHKQVCATLGVNEGRNDDGPTAYEVIQTMRADVAESKSINEFIKVNAVNERLTNTEFRGMVCSSMGQEYVQKDAGVPQTPVNHNQLTELNNVAVRYRDHGDGTFSILEVFGYPIDVLEQLLPALPTPEYLKDKELVPTIDKSALTQSCKDGTCSFIGYITLTPKKTPAQALQERRKEVGDHLENLRRDLGHQTRNGTMGAAKRTEESIRLVEGYEELLKGKEQADD